MNGAFNIIDYLVLGGYLVGLMVVATVFVREKSSREFFTASRRIPWWAAGMSILATLVSAISIVGAPADFFRYGFEGFGIWWLAGFIAAPAIVVFIIFFVRSQVTSAYEYLEKRFSLSVRLVGGIFFMACRGLYIGVVLYTSALVLNRCCGGAIAVPLLIVIAGIFATLYAVVGGIKAVIWTDVIQLIVVYLGVGWIMVTLLGEFNWDFGRVWDTAAASGRDFSYLGREAYWSWDIFEPNTFNLLLIGLVLHALAQKGTDQLTVQRYLTTGDVRASVKALLVDLIGSIPMGLLLSAIGMMLFAWFHEHPGSMPPGLSENEVLSHYLVNNLPHGISGLMAAALMAAVISTVDSGINCLATVTMIDLHQRFRKRAFDDRSSLLWARVWSVIWGAMATLFALFIYATASDTVGRVSTQVIGLFSGAILGIFLLGVFSRRANSFGALTGGIAGAVSALVVNYLVVQVLPDGSVRHVSFVVPMIVGTAVTVVVGMAASFLAPPPRPEQVSEYTFSFLLKRKGSQAEGA